MSAYLLDVNLLIALLWPSHAQHGVALKWFTRHRGKGWATCPVTQAGFVRVVSNPVFSRDAVTPRQAIHFLSANTRAEDHVFWQDDLPFEKAVEFAGPRLVGHQQVTDAYLVGLAIRREGFLATLDQRIAALPEPKSPGRAAIEVIE